MADTPHNLRVISNLLFNKENRIIIGEAFCKETLSVTYIFVGASGVSKNNSASHQTSSHNPVVD